MELMPDAQSRPSDRGERRPRTVCGGLFGEAHRRYTRRINFRKKWRGYLWQGRFASFIMDEAYLLAAARYVELNPVRAKLVDRAHQRPWSSAKAHLKGSDDRLVKVKPLLAMVGDWKAFLRSAIAEEELRNLREHGRTGRPLGSSSFLDHLDSLVGRVLKRQKPGPKPQPRKLRTRKAVN